MSRERWSLRRVFRLPQTSARARRELDDELRFHLQGRVEDLMLREGLSRADAEREARKRFGDYEAYRNEARHIDQSMLQRRNKMEFREAVGRETRHAARSLLRTPSFSLIAFATLALGLGATTTIFTLLDRVVLRPLPYPHAERLVRVGTKWPSLKAGMEYGISQFMFFKFKEAPSLEEVGVYRQGAMALPAANGLDAERVQSLMVSSTLFNVLGIRAELGRLFTKDDQLARVPSVALLTHELWARRFGADRSIIGKSIDVGSAKLTIVGVLAPGSHLPENRAEIWIPDWLNAGFPPRNQHTYFAIALVKQGVPFERAFSELDALTRQITIDYPQTYGDVFMKNTGFGFMGRSLRDDVVGPTVTRALWIIFGSVAVVLLIAAANVANLFLVRIEARRREVAVRTALGADRTHLAVHYLTESCMLALASAAGAVAMAWALLHAAVALSPTTIPRLAEVSLDWRSVNFCVVTALVAGVVFGLLPLTHARLDVLALREGGRSLTSSRARNAVRRALVIAQVALAVVLLSSAGLMLRSYQKLHAVRKGFDATNVLTMDIRLPQSAYKADPQITPFWHELVRRVEALPGVTSVGTTADLPLTYGDGCTAVKALDTRLEESQQMQCLPTTTVAPGYFRTMSIPVRGAEPSWSDVEAGTGTMIVSRALAERMWPGESAIGKQLVYSVQRTLVFTVVGIADDVRGSGLQRPVSTIAYFPLTSPAAAGPYPTADMDVNSQSLVVRSTSGDPNTLGASIRQIVAQIDPRVPVADIRSMEAVVAKSIEGTSFTMTMMLLSAFIALVLSAVGIYGVISYVVGQRRSEIGIRMALGARSGDVSRMVVRQSVGVAVVGIVSGVAVALASARLLQSLLFDVSPNDPIVLASTCVVLVAVTAAASFGPARRASRIDPVEAMRA